MCTVDQVKKHIYKTIKDDYLVSKPILDKIKIYLDNYIDDKSMLLDPYDEKCVEKFMITYLRHTETDYEEQIRNVKSFSKYLKIKAIYQKKAKLLEKKLKIN